MQEFAPFGSTDASQIQSIGAKASDRCGHDGSRGVVSGTTVGKMVKSILMYTVRCRVITACIVLASRQAKTEASSKLDYAAAPERLCIA